MLRHVAVFRWSEGASPADIEAFGSTLAGLPAVIPEIRSYRFGPDAGLGISANGDYAVVADFDDAAGYAAYARHPAHQDVIVRLLRPLVAERMSVQFTFGGTASVTGPSAPGGAG
ncbi:MAG TPA: Dabb family protein [Acidimicrobiales bacterium]|nr:Dabb family protein [Acidimicrobiales bacterium]